MFIGNLFVSLGVGKKDYSIPVKLYTGGGGNNVQMEWYDFYVFNICFIRRVINLRPPGYMLI